jgi:hypothetical protein
MTDDAKGLYTALLLGCCGISSIKNGLLAALVFAGAMSKNGFETAEGAGVVVGIAKGFMVPDPI